MHQTRLARVRATMQASGLTQTIISDPDSIFYLTGQHFHPGERMLALLLGADGTERLFLNDLFTAGPDIGCPVEYYNDTESGPEKLLPFIAPKKALGIDKSWPSGFLLSLLNSAMVREVRPGSFAVDRVRAVKDEDEQALMAAASALNDTCMELFLRQLRPGVTEKQLADEIIRIYADNGAQGLSFPPIVAFGDHGADPHHENGDRALAPGMSVLLDVGCIKDDYCSDMTRTVFTAAPTDRQRLVYETVLAANRAGIAAAKPGVPLCRVDAAARDIIAQAGFGPQFTHRLGHFIGLQDHEFGDVSAANPAKAAPGNCFSIEPGIYLPGEIGVRIEDLLIVTETGNRLLNSAPKDLTVVEL